MGYNSSNVIEELNQYKNVKDQINLNYQGIHTSEIEYENYKSEITKTTQQLTALNKKLKVDNKIRDMLKIVSNAILEDIVLTSLNYIDKDVPDLDNKDNKYSKGILVIEGVIYRNFISADITLIDFITNLKRSNFFQEVNLTDQRKDIKENVFQFKIECKV